MIDFQAINKCVIGSLSKGNDENQGQVVSASQPG